MLQSKGRDEVPKEIENLMNIKFKSGGKKSCVMVAYVMRLTEPFPPLSALSLLKSVGKHLAIIPVSCISQSKGHHEISTCFL